MAAKSPDNPFQEGKYCPENGSSANGGFRKAPRLSYENQAETFLGYGY